MARKRVEELDFYELLEEKYSDYVRTKKNDDDDKIDKVIPTGSPSLDISTGVGGIPLKRLTEIYGAESTGKTTLALSIAGNAIKSGYKVLYVDVEQAVDFDYGKVIIGDAIEDKDKFLLIQPGILEHSLHIVERGIQSGDFGLVILDSVGGLVPKKVKEETLEDSNPYILAKKMTVFAERNAYDIRHFDVAFLAVNQVRDNTSNPYLKGPNALMSPGGHAYHHALSLQIRLHRGGLIEQNDTVVGLSTKFLVVKNKVAPPFRSFSIPIIFGKGIDYYGDLADFAIALGVISRFGSIYKFNDITLGKGVADTVNTLKSDKVILDNILNMCYNIVRVNKGIINEGDEDEEVYQN